MSQFTNSITVGPEFFSKAKNDYRDWRWALAREFMQNSIDAPRCRNITINIGTVDGHTTLEVINDGAPMARDVLVNKLLSLGSSGKNFADGSVGGFGKAKELLYFTHRNYRIVTGNLLVEGSGAGYNLTELPDVLAVKGTESKIWMDGDYTEALTDAFQGFIVMSQWSGTITLNDKEIDTRLNKGRGRKNLKCGRVYTNSDQSNVLICRVGGIPMFYRQISYKGCIILELEGKSVDFLQSSRDQLKSDYVSELDEFIISVSIDKRSAFREKPEVTIDRYPGYKLVGRARITNKISEACAGPIKAAAYIRNDDSPVPDASELVKQATDGKTDEVTREQLSQELRQLAALTRAMPLRPDFFIKNETGLKIPAWFRPDGFSTYSKTLLQRWTDTLLLLAEITGSVKQFSVGFIFNEDCPAQHDDGVIYVRAAEVIRRPKKSPVLQCQWKFDNDGIWDLVASAAHEFVHFEYGIHYHDEDFAARLTSIMAKALAERTRFTKIFQKAVAD